jgi:hypothetical protein
MQDSVNPYGAGELTHGTPQQYGSKMQSNNYSLRNNSKVKHSSVGYQLTHMSSANKSQNGETVNLQSP